VATVVLLDELDAAPVLTDLCSEIPFVADAAALSALLVIAGVVCLDAVQLRRIALVR
jgi:hypothetical protein